MQWIKHLNRKSQSPSLCGARPTYFHINNIAVDPILGFFASQTSFTVHNCLPRSRYGHLINYFARKFFWEKPAAALDTLPAVFNHRREKRVFYALDHYTIQKLDPSKQQTGQEWNCDLHDCSPKFPLDKSSRQGACQTPLLLEQRTNIEIHEISRLRNFISVICDERKCRVNGTSRNSGLV
jgi:hypothetical protein